ncbi:hypothetical protein GCM10010869_19800 [Mesorhizobium tianshanense]|uniref:Uncharacterized protein n=1 Tax=Mesorhizobium tianshanense TaxID=39844 RepID=A0A562N3J7_9HYPH|nr:hypothetical protein [Mesorhizobium tianshanense]TWI26724.1 hypothetical protein IQ26_05901 [Mesorhizobium tianshanense]GLS36391.1 hypothetical protein GCM10010869_19800 [Mesorhizobium tianshanense]
MSTSATVDDVDPGALTLTHHEKLNTGAMARAHRLSPAVLAKGMARLASMFKIERASIVLLLAAILGAMAVTNGAHAEQSNLKMKHGISQAVKQSPTTPRLARRTETLRPSGKLPFADKIRPRIQAKIDCAAIGCKAKPPILKHQRKGLPCKIVGCKPGNGGHGGHHGNHHNHHKHGSWAWGGVTIVAADHGGCGYEFWKWKTTGWRYWRHAYLSCRDWE